MASMGIEMVGVQQVISDLEHYKDERLSRIKTAVKETALEVRNSAVTYAPVDRNRLRSSIHIEYDDDGLGAAIKPGLDKEVYPTVMELGRKPGAKMPPYGPGSKLYEWVRRHKMAKTVRSKVTYQGVSLAQYANDRALLRMARTVAASIARKGIRPRRYMQLAADANNARFIERMRRVL
jgi:hypothetical protein